MTFCEESHSCEEIGLVFTKTKTEHKNSPLYCLHGFFVCLFGVCFVCTRRKFGRMYTSHLMLILHMSWRGWGDGQEKYIFL